jgi:phytoene dehydrogenase-like protein
MGSKDRSIIIIGAGAAGLSAGVYAQLNGYTAHIFEMNDQPGGALTTWERNGYRIEGCIESLHGSRSDSRGHQMWRELGASGARLREFIEHDEYLRVRDLDGRELIFYADIDQLQGHLLELSPLDKKLVLELTGALRKMAAYDPLLDWNLIDALLDLPARRAWLSTFNHYNQVTIEAFAARFKDPFLRRAFPALAPPGMPMGVTLNTLAFQSARNKGYPLGGSLAVSQDIASRFCALGGEIHYSQRVTKILTLQKSGGARAVGVQTEDGQQFFAGTVLSAADGYATLYQLLEKRFLTPELRMRYEKLPLTPASVQIALGVRRDFSSEPHARVDLLKQPLYFAGRSHTTLRYHHFGFDPSVAARGKTVILARVRSNYDYWKKLSDESTRYESEKLSVADVFIDHLEKRTPGLRKDLEMIDVATPLSFEKFTGARQGVYQSFALNPQTAVFAARGMSPEIPGLANCYQIGQWIQPGGGVFPAARSGREIIQHLCARDRQRFTTTG